MSDATEREPRRLSYTAAAGFTFLAGLLAQVVVQLTSGLRAGATADAPTLVASKVGAYGLLLFALLRLYEPDTSVRTVLGLRGFRAIETGLGLVVGAGLAPLGSVVDGYVARRSPPTAEELALLERIFASDTSLARVSVVLALGLVLPVADELFFRGAILTPLVRGRALANALVATAAYDALLPMSARGLMSFAALVAVLALLRFRSRSIWPSLAARVGFFATAVSPVAFGRDELDLTLRMSLALALVSSLALAAYIALTRSASPRAGDAA